MKKNILVVIGSLKKKSLNRMLAEYVEGYLADRAEFKYLDYSDLPMINPDEEFPAPAPVKRIRDEFKAADGVWIFFPEYNYSYPAPVKNLLDWVSRPVAKDAPRTSSVSSGIKVTYSSVSGSAQGMNCFDNMDELLQKIHMEQMKDGLVKLNDPESDGVKLLLTNEQEAAIKSQADNFMKFL